MTRRGTTLMFALAALGFLGVDAHARGFRGGGFGGGAYHMGSVRYGRSYRPDPYRRNYAMPYRRDDAARPAAQAYHRPVARAAAHVPPPAWGARVRVLPAGYRRRWWRNRYWYYGGDMWYYQDGGAYVASQPPLGMIVYALPEGATKRVIGGRTYYVFREIWFKPVLSGGGMSYEVVRQPAGA
jgi:hypothetical protein